MTVWVSECVGVSCSGRGWRARVVLPVGLGGETERGGAVEVEACSARGQEGSLAVAALPLPLPHVLREREGLGRGARQRLGGAPGGAFPCWHV